jgi:HK97 gp10 family phage protein
MPRDDLASVLKALNAVPKGMKEAIRPAIDKGADEMIGRMKYLAPKGDTGELERSIRKTDLNDLAVRIEAGGPLTTKTVSDKRGVAAYEYDYALGIEYGNAHQRPQSFFWSTINTSKRRVRRRIDRAISKAAKEAFSK